MSVKTIVINVLSSTRKAFFRIAEAETCINYW